MDLTNIQAGKPKLNGFDFEISATTNLQFSFSTIYDFLDTVTTSINNLSTKAQYRTQDNLDTVQDNINAVGGLVAQTSEEINYVEYPQAKQRLENALANLTNQVSSDSTTLQQIKTISTTINTPNNIQPNQQDINNIHQQIMSLINEEQNKLLAINVSENKMEESYENFLAILSTQNDLANL
jgi:predicted  nucleic acid-binding Zn-ribbon protein